MTPADLHYLQTDAARQLVAQNATADAAKWALANREKLGPQAALIATQIALRQKAEAKLPTWAAANTIFEPQAFEQSTAEKTLLLKQDWRGARALDLTCGLGLDAWALAKRFGYVIALERNPVLAELARYNFKLLAIENLEVVQADATQWLAAYEGPRFDLVYADPARRTNAKPKAVALADMEPDVHKLMPLLLRHAERVLLKLSPLYEVTQAWRDVPHLQRVLVLSTGGECKEVLVEIKPGAAPQTQQVEARILRRVGIQVVQGTVQTLTSPFGTQGKYLYEPDVAVYKAGLLPVLLQKHPAAQATGPQGYWLSNEVLHDFPGRGFAINHIMPYKPRTVVTYLRQHNLRKANVARRAFKLTVVEIRKQLQLAEGGMDYLFCTDTPEGPMLYFCRPMNESSSA